MTSQKWIQWARNTFFPHCPSCVKNSPGWLSKRNQNDVHASVYPVRHPTYAGLKNPPYPSGWRVAGIQDNSGVSALKNEHSIIQKVKAHKDCTVQPLTKSFMRRQNDFINKQEINPLSWNSSNSEKEKAHLQSSFLISFWYISFRFWCSLAHWLNP